MSLAPLSPQCLPVASAEEPYTPVSPPTPISHLYHLRVVKLNSLQQQGHVQASPLFWDHAACQMEEVAFAGPSPTSGARLLMGQAVSVCIFLWVSLREEKRSQTPVFWSGQNGLCWGSRTKAEGRVEESSPSNGSHGCQRHLYGYRMK